MKLRSILLLTLAVAALVAPLQAQGPMYDKIVVTLPHPVTLNDKVLQPGEYTIQQMSGATNNRVLFILTDGGMKHETTVMTIPTLDNKTPEDTKVVLHHIGNDYFFDKIWVQGKNYGYEFVLPDAVKSRQKEMALSVAARYEAAPAQQEAKTEVKTETPPAPPAEPKQAEAQPEKQQPDKEAEARAQAEREAQAQAERERAQRESEQAERDRLAQAEQQRKAQEQTRVPAQPAEPAPAPPQEPPAVQPPAAQPTEPAKEEMPATSLNWLGTLLAGGGLTGLGLLLRRRRS